MMRVERLSVSDVDAATTALSAAFRDYPVMRFTLADAGDAYDERLRTLVGFFCNKRFVQGWPVLGVRVDGEVAAVALINEPGAVPDAAAAERLHRELVESIGEPAFTRFNRYENESDLDAPEGPHHFLGVLGVHPDRQGLGLGRVLMEELAVMCDEHPDSRGVCLNTEDPGNVAFYERMGYRVIGRRTIDTLETWCMFRPRSA